MNAQLPGAWFVGVHSAIGKACSPQSRVVSFVGAKIAKINLAGPQGLYIVAVKSEVAAQVNGGADAPDLSVFISCLYIKILQSII